MKLGVSEYNAAITAYRRKSYWFMSACYSVHHALNNERLREIGLIMPDEYYNAHKKQVLNEIVPLV